MNKLQVWLKNFSARKHILSDSAYGTIPAQAGPSEGFCIRLIPVDADREGAEISSGTANRKRSRRIK